MARPSKRGGKRIIMKRFILAFQFLTIIPIRTSGEVSRSDLAASMAYFPLVGAFQGGVLLLLVRLLSTNGLLPDPLMAGVLLLALALTNGGLHLDGFADTVDGLAGGHTPQERLRIMKDSATGAIGMVFLILIILLKYLAVFSVLSLGGWQAHAFIFLFPVAARWAMVPLANLAPYARKEGGLGEPFAGMGAGVMFVATAITFAVSFLAAGVFSFAPLVLLAFAAFVSSVFFRGKLGGVTGDVFGFQSEVSEVLYLVSAPVFLKILPALL